MTIVKAIICLLVCTLSFASNVGATNYYIAANGNDANTGVSMLAPWKSIDKVNSMMPVFTAGDSILFKCNDAFLGQINLTKSGTVTKKIVIASYGNGNKPIINAAVTVTGWVASGITNVWVANYTGVLNDFRYLTANEVVQPMGRYPNATAANDGFLYHDEAWEDYQLRDAANLSSKFNWTGATAVVYSTPYSIDICRIARHLNDTITLAQPTAFKMYSGYGYFIQNHLATLDADGEWYYDTLSKKIYYYSRVQPSNVLIQAAAYNHSILCADKISDVVINNLSFKNTDSSSISFKNVNRIAITNCLFYNCLNGVRGESSNDIQVLNCQFNYIHNNAVWMANLNNNVSVINNLITNQSLIQGLGLGGGSGNNNAISVLGTNSVISSNTINKCGYIGIRFEGYNGLISENRISEFNMRQFDGAAIYSFGTTSSVIGKGRLYGENRVEKNAINNGIGYRKGTNAGDGVNRQPGIYMDFYSTGNVISQNILYNTNGILLNNGSNNHWVNNNTLYNSDSFNLAHPDIACIHMNEGSSSHTVANNTLYNISQKINLDPYSVIVLDRRTGQGLDSLLPFVNRNNRVVKNLFFSAQNTRHLPIAANYGFVKYPNLFSTIDSNFYWQPLALDSFVASFIDSGYTKTNEVSMGVTAWQKRFEPHATFQLADTAFPFTYGTVLRNVFTTNTTFATNLSSWSFDSENASNAVSWVASGGLDAGCVQLNLANAASNVNLWSSARLFRSIGAVAAGDVYRLKFSMIANSNNGQINVYTTGANSTSKTYQTSTTRKNYEIPICISNAAAANVLYFSIHTKGLKVFLDNIVLEKLSINQTAATEVVRLEVNDSNKVKKIDLGANQYKDFWGNTYTGNLSLNAYTSIVLVKKTAVALPIQLLHLNVQRRDNAVLLLWKTTNEVDIQGFWVEKSEDGKQFFPSKWVDAQLQTVNEYTYSDVPSQDGSMVFYRIKILNIDGSYEYSKVVNLSPLVPSLSMQIRKLGGSDAPLLQAIVQSSTQLNSKLTIYNMAGKILHNQAVVLNVGTNYMNIPNSADPIFIVALTTANGQTLIQKIVK